MVRFLVLLPAFLLVAACSTVMERDTQEVAFETPGARGAVCYARNGGMKYKIWPPQKTIIAKEPAPLEVECIAPGNRRKTVYIEPETQGIALANAFNGFIPGIAVDYETGALFKYPNVISIDFRDIKPSPQPLPDYQLLLLENPQLADMEEFRPGLPALQSDRYDAIPELQKRDFSDGPPKTGLSSPPSTTSGGGGDSSESSSSESGGSADSLTKQMNPEAFGPAQSGDGGSGFAGGTAAPAEGGPVQIFPVE